MTTELTARQTQILKVLIDEYIETAEPVGSLALERKYNLGISPATIRNEMAALIAKGYLRQPHTSAGRVPSPQAMKFYINQLMDEKQVSVMDEVQAKEKVWDVRNDPEELMREATEALAIKTGSLAVGTIEDEGVWCYGHSFLFRYPNMFNEEMFYDLFATLEESKRLQELFFHRLTGINPIEVLFGEELEWGHMAPLGIVATRFTIGDKSGAIGIVGPYGLNYPSIIPTVRYFGSLIRQMTNEQETSQG